MMRTDVYDNGEWPGPVNAVQSHTLLKNDVIRKQSGLQIKWNEIKLFAVSEGSLTSHKREQFKKERMLGGDVFLVENKVFKGLRSFHH